MGNNVLLFKIGILCNKNTNAKLHFLQTYKIFNPFLSKTSYLIPIFGRNILFSHIFTSFSVTIFWFVNFIIFLEIRLSFLSKSVYRSPKKFFKSNYMLEIVFRVILCWAFL